MRVLVACEHSGKVREAFRARGHDAWSCDFLPASDNSRYHYQCDVRLLLQLEWGMIIAFPTCTYLTCAAEWAYRDDPGRYTKPHILIGSARRAARNVAVDFFLLIAGNKCARIVIENPVGVMSTRWRKPDQTIQPYQFGHDASKRTCLWLKGVPLLQLGVYVKPRMVDGLPRWSNQSDSGQSNVPETTDRGHKKGITYSGVATAFAAQWG